MTSVSVVSEEINMIGYLKTFNIFRQYLKFDSTQECLNMVISSSTLQKMLLAKCFVISSI